MPARSEYDGSRLGGARIPRPKPSLVVLPDVAKRLLKDVVVADLELDIEGLAEGLSDLLIAADGGLPALEAHAADDLIDPVDDVVHDNRGLVSLEGFEELRQCGLALLLTGDLIDGLLGSHRVARQFQELAQEVEAGLLNVGVFLSQGVQALSELDEHGVVEVSGDTGGDLLLDVLGRDVGALAQHQVLDGLGVEDDRFDALRDLDLDVLVDQVDRLGAKRVPDETAGDVGGAD